ncbi:head-tail connector protein [Schlesneria paludicola]|uniref:head-tail connector protein n=1 Tax=Schlesneria paludicola TaxID=360056 RepID=UPI00029A2503|nr:phage head-tail connector protein [Schlesneria paludicola]
MSTTEPVALATLKQHLRLNHSHQDALLNSLISVAREQVEADTWRSLIPISGRSITRRGFPMGDEALYLPKPPLRAITSVSYVDSTGTTQTFTTFRVDISHEPGSIEPNYPMVWPVSQDGPASVTIVYDCGYADAASVPASLKHAILLIAAQLYENSEPVEIKGDTTLDRLCRPYRVRKAAMLESIWTAKPIHPKFPGGFGLWSGAPLGVR